MREVTIYIDGRQADTYRNDSVTLDFNSSILSDVSSIKCSASKTIRLPKTLNNDAIFDLAHMPSRDSDKARKVLSCEMYADGVAVFSRGLCHLLSSDGDHYEVAMTFGIMHAGFEQWLKDKPKLRDLQDSDSDVVAWDSTAGVTTYGGGISKIEKYDVSGQPSMLYALYNVGLPLTNETRQNYNISPCVSLLEIMERIRRENALPFDIDNIESDMEMNAIVLTKNNNISLQTITADADIKQEIPPLQTPNNERRIGLNIASEIYDTSSFSFVYKGYGQMVVNLPRINLTMIPEMFDKTDPYFSQSAVNFFASTRNCNMVVEYPDGTLEVIAPAKSGNTFYWNERTLTFDAPQGEDVEGKPLFKIYIKLNRWNSCPDDVWSYPNKGAGVTSWRYTMQKAFVIKPTRVTDTVTSFTATYQNNSNDYPLQEFRLVPNLPDITQIDFINFICNLYGVYPVADGQSVRFARFSELIDNIAAGNIYDWSELLTEQYPYYPNRIDLALDGYAQRNIVTYKEDKNDPVDISASLVVEDESLEYERRMIEFPFAASRGNLIPQYSLNDKGEVQSNDCEYRLMRFKPGFTSIEFLKELYPQQILNRHYSELQDAIHKPMQIEEDIMLSLLDLQTIDYSKPVYLSKYGRYFAIISIQWQSDQQTCKVKLLRIK